MEETERIIKMKKKSNYEVLGKCELNTINNDRFFLSLSLFDKTHYFLYMSGKHGYFNIPVQDVPELINLLEQIVSLSHEDNNPLA